MKIVIDANIYFSALYSSKGISNKFLQWLFEEYINFQRKYNIVSVPLILEMEDVLKRENNLKLFQRNKEEIDNFINAIIKISYRLKTMHYLWRPFLKDPKDDMIIETAFNGKARFIITYNTKHFKNIKEIFGIKSITPGEFLKIMGGK